MSVTLHEDAIRNLLSSEGPVGEHIQERALRVAIAAQANARIIMHRKPDVVNAIDVAFDSEGQATIGIRDEGSISRYLAEKEARERVWLVPALAAEFESR